MTIEPERLARSLSEALGEAAALVAAWADTVPVPDEGGLIVRAVYAFPSRRLATLRHWRDEVELDMGAIHVVGLEASKWARLLLKSHGGALLASTAAPTAVGMPGPAAALPELARTLWDATATEWARAARVDPLPDARPLTAEQRFDRVEAWLWSVREAVDSPTGAPIPPGARPSSPNQ